MTREQLVKLRVATDVAIGRPESAPAFEHEAINWFNLHCVQAAWVISDDEESYAQVTIEEASPEAYKFCSWIEAKLAKAGWPDVRVVTEW